MPGDGRNKGGGTQGSGRRKTTTIGLPLLPALQATEDMAFGMACVCMCHVSE